MPDHNEQPPQKCSLYVRSYLRTKYQESTSVFLHRTNNLKVMRCLTATKISTGVQPLRQVLPPDQVPGEYHSYGASTSSRFSFIEVVYLRTIRQKRETKTKNELPHKISVLRKR
jgi:hypothetical protein